MKKDNRKIPKWMVFLAAFAVLGILTLILLLLSGGPQQGPFMYQIQ